MKISVKQAGVEIYAQVLDDSKTLNNVIAHLMQQPTGTLVQAVVSNNGHDMTFNSTSLEIEPLIRKVNGIVTREGKKKAVVTTEA
jgi:hypothetical protein